MTAGPHDARRIEHLRSALEGERPSAEVLAALIESLLAVDDRSGALSSYRRYAAEVQAGDRQAAQRLRALYERALWNAPNETLPTNVPPARHVLIGRERETHAVAEAVAKSRIVSLTGPGGVGKTRIAVEVARRLLPEFPDGVWWVDLAAVGDGAYCAEHLANAMGVSSFASDEAALVDLLSAQSALVVFDGCERVTAEVRGLANRIVAACTGMRILCTSRSPLGTNAERTFPIDPLPVPGAEESNRAAILRSAAVQIFIERATAADARFALTDDNAAEVSALCRRLGGLPLALELAASSAAHLPIAQIAPGNDPALQRTIAWSYDALNEQARSALEHLSIFAAPFGFQEAASVVRTGTATALKQLIDASLLQMRSAAGAAEYFLLDSTREFLESRCTTQVLLNAARRAIGFYASEKRVERSFANIARCIALLAGDEESASDRLSVLAAMGARFAMSGHVDETAAMCERMLAELSDGLRQTKAYADVLRTLVWVENRRGRFQAALERSQGAIAAARAAGDLARVVRALSNLYIVAIHVGDYDLARSAGAEALELSRASGDAEMLCNALRAAAGTHVAIGDFSAAIPLYDELLQLDLERVPKPVFAMALHDYALARMHLGETDLAQALARRSAEVSIDAHDPGTESDAYNVLGRIALIRGDLEKAFGFYRHALALCSRPGAHPITLARTLEGCTACALRDDQMEQAAQVLGFADQVLQRLHSPRQPFERPQAEALHAAVSSRLGAERFQAALLIGRTRSYREVRATIEGWQPGNAPPERAQRFSTLTARERDIAERAAGGATNREISDALSVSVRTVENHLAAIYKKLGIGSRAELQIR